MAKEKKTQEKVCAFCGSVFVATHGLQRYCVLCRSQSARCRSRRGDLGRSKRRLKGNQGAIEQLALEAQENGTTYGKWEGRRYAEKHVRVAPKITKGSE